jgi:hypothetical protein
LPGTQSKYAPVRAGERLFQGEVISGVIQVRLPLQSIGAEELKLDEVIHPFAVIFTQDCDLEQDFEGRKAGRAKLEHVLFCQAVPTTNLKSQVSLGKERWKLLTENRDIRYQCIENVIAGDDSESLGIPSLGIDFKSYFTIPVDEVYKRIEIGQIARRARLVTPYAEHLLHRFCSFQSRVPLPVGHVIPL